MKRCLQLALTVLLALAAPPNLVGGEVLDRVAATVNDGVILESEWDDALRYECFLNGRLLQQLTPADRSATLERLIDQLLLAQQLETTGFNHATPDEVAARIREIRNETPGAGTDAGWKLLLARYGLTAEVLAERVGRQIDLERYVDQRFRPSVYVDAESIQNYYRSRLVPELQRKQSAVPRIEEVRARIERVLAEERMNELLAAWLKTLRAQSRIEVK
ncbi:MAG: SurA N-terminal domain-containing protein [Acidobacteria bacterium]|nr:SurA N-terminal domain-containing protein [Acidobacteriota bacterium]